MASESTGSGPAVSANLTVDPLPLFRAPTRPPPVFPVAAWQEKTGYFLSNHPQGTALWHYCRTFRLTASNAGKATGRGYVDKRHGGSHAQNQFTYALMIVKLTEEQFDAVALGRMAHGTATEPAARTWYEWFRGGITVEEVGLAVPKWETRIGASVDGDLPAENGIIEIKCPARMYPPLLEHFAAVQAGQTFPPGYHEHIALYYYCQMQMNMKVTGRAWCDYVVYALDSNQVYCERVPFNPSFWENELWPDLQYFLNEIVDPVLDLIVTIAPDYDYVSEKWPAYVARRKVATGVDLSVVLSKLNTAAAWTVQGWQWWLTYFKFRFMVNLPLRSAMLAVVQSYCRLTNHASFTLVLFTAVPMLYPLLRFLQSDTVWFTLSEEKRLVYVRSYMTS